MFQCFRASSDMGDEAVRIRDHASHKLSLNLLRKWNFFRQMKSEELLKIRAFYAFSTAPQVSCGGGTSIIYIAEDDSVYGIGHNCSTINILGISRDCKPGYKTENVTKPVMIKGLSNKKIKDLSIGGVIGAAITGNGELLWWGLCKRRYGEIMTPQTPRNGKERFFKVSCGLRMMAALSESRRVHVWGQIFSHTAFLEGEVLAPNHVISEISCGYHHIAMMDSNGNVFTWGRGNEGQRSLAKYSFRDQSQVRRLDVEPCAKIRSGPLSTFCLTRYRELWACGTNRNRYLGTQDRSAKVKTLSRITNRNDFSDFVVLWCPDSSAQMAATTSTGDFFSWGDSVNPCDSQYVSFFEFFVDWETTPGVTSVCYPEPHHNFSSLIRLTPRDLRTVNFMDVLAYIYRRDHPDIPVNRSPRLSTRDISYLPNRVTSEEGGKEFIMEKFLQDVCMRDQDELSQEGANRRSAFWLWVTRRCWLR